MATSLGLMPPSDRKIDSCFNAEACLDAQYQKFKHNNGGIFETDTAPSLLAQAFSHSSFEYADRRSIIFEAAVLGVATMQASPPAPSLLRRCCGCRLASFASRPPGWKTSPLVMSNVLQHSGWGPPDGVEASVVATLQASPPAPPLLCGCCGLAHVWRSTSRRCPGRASLAPSGVLLW